MKYCKSCKEELPEKAKYCPSCGQKVNSKKVDNKEVNDIEENKGITIFSYLGPLAFIPYFLAKDSKFARYHALQGLNLFLVWVIHIILSSVVSFMSIVDIFGSYAYIGNYTAPIYIIIGAVVLCFAGVIIFSLQVMGVIDVIKGETNELPIIGKIKIIK